MSTTHKNMRDTILIVGAGAIGTLTAIRLLHNATEPVEIFLLEKDPSLRAGGLAYSRQNTSWAMMLNVQAGRIPAFREHPDDLLRWLNHEADRSSWPEPWKTFQFGPTSPVVRGLYQQYLYARLEQAQQMAAPGVTLTWLVGEAVDLVEEEEHVQLVYLDYEIPDFPAMKTIIADQVILATGHLPSACPDFACGIAHHPLFIQNQYSPQGQSTLKQVDKDGSVFIIGTGLSAFDAVQELLANGHRGPIILHSRHGYIHFTYAPDHTHEIIRVRRPPFLEKETLSVEDVVAGIIEEFQYHQRNSTHIPPVLLSERLIKAWEPYVAELVNRLPAEDVQYLLRKYHSLIVTRRVGTVYESGSPILERMRPCGNERPQISILPGQVRSMQLAADGKHITIRLQEPTFTKETELEVTTVISCLGNQADYTRVNNVFWRNIIDRRKLAVPHRKTRRGIEVDEHGELMKAGGTYSQSLYAVGPIRQGDEIQRRGRLGGFIFSLGSTRNQAFDTAMTVLGRLKERRQRAQGDVPLLPFDTTLTNIGTQIACAAMKQHGSLDMADTLEEQIRSYVDAALQGDVLETTVAALAVFQPEQRRALEREKMHALADLHSKLTSLDLDPALVRQIVDETGCQAERLAVRRLTDITTVVPVINHPSLV